VWAVRSSTGKTGKLRDDVSTYTRRGEGLAGSWTK
jgi:hypothetical protein